jgi:hypothetical protein
MIVKKLLYKRFFILVFLVLAIAGCPGIYQPGDTVYPAAIDPGDSAAIRAILDSNGLKNISVRRVIPQYSKDRIYQVNLDSLQLNSISITKDFEKLDSLTTINLSQNKLSTISVPENLQFILGNRLSVDISHNSFTSFPLAIFKIKRIFYFDISNNGITNIPQEVINSTNTQFVFYYNKLCNVSDTVAKWLDSTNTNWRNVQTCP